jgi:hypothetical protein
VSVEEPTKGQVTHNHKTSLSDHTRSDSTLLYEFNVHSLMRWDTQMLSNLLLNRQGTVKF